MGWGKVEQLAVALEEGTPDAVSIYSMWDGDRTLSYQKTHVPRRQPFSAHGVETNAHTLTRTYLYQDSGRVIANRCSGLLHSARYRIKEAGSVHPPFSIIQDGVWCRAS